MKTTETTVFRTQDEIVAEIKRIKATDFLGFRRTDLVVCLDHEHAKPFLAEGTSESYTPQPHDRETILKTMENYMEFAWDKANNCRGISASRTMDHYSSWIWLIGDEAEFGDLTDYEYYGKDHLRHICDFYGWDADKWDDGRRVNS